MRAAPAGCTCGLHLRAARAATPCGLPPAGYPCGHPCGLPPAGCPLHAFPSSRHATSHAAGKPIVVTVTLSGDTWVDAVGADDFGDGPTTDLINGITAGVSSLTGWNNIIRPGIQPANVERVDDATVVITVSEFFDFDIQQPETVTVTVPASALVSDMAIVAAPPFEMLPVGASVTIGGELADGSSEVAIQRGLLPTLTIVLNSDTFVSAIGLEHDPDGPTMELIRSLRSAQAEATGWNAIVQPGLRPSDIRYVSASQVDVVVPQFPAYDVHYPETIGVAIPAVCMRNNPLDIPDAAAFTVYAARGTAVLTGSLLQRISEAEIAAGASAAAHGGGAHARQGNNVTVSLLHDTFAPWAMCGDDGYQNITNLTSAPLPDDWCWSPPPAPPGAYAWPPAAPPGGGHCAAQQPRGWNAVLASVPCDGVRRLSDTRVQLSLPAYAAYDIDAPETIALTLRPQALTSQQPTLASPRFDVRPERGDAELAGTLAGSGANEASVRAGGGVLEIKVERDQWVPAMDDFLKVTPPTPPLPSPPTHPTPPARTHAPCPRTTHPHPPSPTLTHPHPHLSTCQVEVLAGLASTALEARGWANVVRHALRPEHLEVVDWYTARLTLPACPSYDVRSAETLALHVPAAALISGRELDAAMPLEVAAVPGTAALSGFVDYDSTEAALRWGVASRCVRPFASRCPAHLQTQTQSHTRHFRRSRPPLLHWALDTAGGRRRTTRCSRRRSRSTSRSPTTSGRRRSARRRPSPRPSSPRSRRSRPRRPAGTPSCSRRCSTATCCASRRRRCS